MNDFKKGVVQTLLEKMFKADSHFSICDLDKLGELTGTNPRQHPNYTELSALHCVNYRDMPAVVRAQLQQKVVECLRPELSINVNAMAYLITAEGSNFTPIEDEQFPLGLTKQ